jgi:hypothetical protein
MGASITSWENVAAYFTFADNPAALVLFAMGVTGIVAGLIGYIIKHENDAFEQHK